jgi:hypothetical protein
MSESTEERIGFLIWPNGITEELTEDGNVRRTWSDDGELYTWLLDEGYPKTGSAAGDRWAEAIDVSVNPANPADVIAFTEGEAPHEHAVNAAPFVNWCSKNGVWG